VCPLDLESYIAGHIDPEGEYLHALWRATQLHSPYGQMASGHIQGCLLRMFVRMIRPKYVLELGTFSGYMKFTAPTTKTYSFTISNVRSNTGRYACGFGYVMRYSGYGDSIGQVPVSTKGGSNTTMWFASRKSSGGFIPKRTGKITLNQGETVYLYLSASSSLSKSVSLKYTIK